MMRRYRTTRTGDGDLLTFRHRLAMEMVRDVERFENLGDGRFRRRGRER